MMLSVGFSKKDGGISMTDQNRELVLTLDGERILQDFQVWVSLDDGTSIKLDLSDIVEGEKVIFSNQYKEIRHIFKDKEELIKLTLIFKQYRDVIFGYVEAKINNKRAIHRHKHFALENGIVLKVKSSSAIGGLMALYRHKDWWTRPFFKKELGTLPARTQSLLWKKEDNFYYMIPVVHEIFKSDFSGNGEGMDIRVSAFTGGCDSCEALVFAAAVGKEPFELSKRTVEKTLEELGYPTFSREKKRYPEALKYLGWCSWDAFYHAVSEKGLLEKAEELKEKKLPVRWMMIDDGWLDVKNEGLMSFNANKDKFPQGLKAVSSKLKELYGVRWVGVWHAFMGYWGGINPDSGLAKSLGEYLYRTNSNKLIPYPDASRGFGFWNEWYTNLRREGIDFVKVDGQSAVNNFLIYNEPVGKSAREAHKALEAAVGIHFDNCIINCMGMALENIWSRPISAVSRNSDDFVPGEEISFKEHALQNSYNSYFHSNFYWGDWDMFWTNHNEDVQNSVLRAVSGGPVYFSDRVGNTDPATILPLVMKDGKLLRGDNPGLPTVDCLFYDPNEEAAPLKVWNTFGKNGVLAVFNINLKGERVIGTVSPSDIPGQKEGTYLVYDHFNNKINQLSCSDKQNFELEKDKAALFVIIPKKGEFTPIGLVNKYLSPAAIIGYYESDEKKIVSLENGGIFGFVSERRVVRVRIDGKETSVKNEGEKFYSIDCSEYAGQFYVEITVE
jgi:raffinose synthase